MLVGPELITGGKFDSWTADNPDGWSITGESGGAIGSRDPEVSQVGTGQSHANAGGETGGMCNLYTSDGTTIILKQTMPIVVGHKYRVSIDIDTVTAGSLRVFDDGTNMFANQSYTTTGTKTFTFVATATSIIIGIARHTVAFTDVTFDAISIREELPTELSRTGQHFSSHQGN
jgi:hypothetical protein